MNTSLYLREYFIKKRKLQNTQRINFASDFFILTVLT